MPKRSPAKIDYRDCEKRGRRCLLISQQCRWRFGKISLSVFRYDTSSDSAIGKQLKLPVRSILNQSQLNHVWDQYGRCLYACTIDDKLVVKRDSVVFVEVRSRYTFTTSWFSAVKSLAYENTTLVRSFEFGRKLTAEAYFENCPLFALISFDTYRLRTDYNAWWYFIVLLWFSFIFIELVVSFT